MKAIIILLIGFCLLSANKCVSEKEIPVNGIFISQEAVKEIIEAGTSALRKVGSASRKALAVNDTTIYYAGSNGDLYVLKIEGPCKFSLERTGNGTFSKSITISCSGEKDEDLGKIKIKTSEIKNEDVNPEKIEKILKDVAEEIISRIE